MVYTTLRRTERPNPGLAFVPLERPIVLRVSDKAVLVNMPHQKAWEGTWFPRSVLQDGDAIQVNTEEVLVRLWYIQKHGMQSHVAKPKRLY